MTLTQCNQTIKCTFSFPTHTRSLLYIMQSNTLDSIHIAIVLLQRLQPIEHTVRQMDIVRSNTLDLIRHRYCEMGLGFKVSECGRTGLRNWSTGDR